MTREIPLENAGSLRICQTSHQIQVLIVAAVAIIQLSGFPMATAYLRCQRDQKKQETTNKHVRFF